MIHAIEHLIDKTTTEVQKEPNLKLTTYETIEATINSEATAD